jgi:hypothetical protein
MNETFENTPRLAPLKTSGTSDQSTQPLKSVVHMDGTINTYPSLDNSALTKRYRRLKGRAEHIKLQIQELKLAKLDLVSDGIKTITFENSINEKLQQLQVVESKLSRSYGHYQQKNTNKKGVTLSTKKKQRIRNVLTYKYATKEKNVFEFTTFTVPSKRTLQPYSPVDDDELVTKQLSKLLENLRKNYGLKSYLWVAERQTGKRNKTNKGTGAIHYHCVFEWEHSPIRIQILNLYWLTLLDKIGYQTTNTKYTLSELETMFGKSFNARIIQGYRGRNITRQMNIQGNTLIMKTPEFITQLDGKGKVKNPHLKCMLNPVDTKKIRDLKGLKYYITKYITKNNQTMHSRVYAMSRDLTKLDLKVLIESKQIPKLELDEMTLFDWQKTFEIELTNAKFYYSKHIIKNETWSHRYYSIIYEYFMSQNDELLKMLNPRRKKLTQLN